VDKFGKYKPVVIITLLFNAVFHHALFIIPQQEIPGTMPSAYVIRHPQTGSVEVWWSPCPSRECTDEEEINIVVDDCMDHCLLFELEQNPKIVPQLPTKASGVRVNVDAKDDLNFILSKKRPSNQSQSKVLIELTTEMSISTMPSSSSSSSLKPSTRMKQGNASDIEMDVIYDDESILVEEEEEDESWVAGSGESIFMRIDMHPDLGDPIEGLGMELEDVNDDNVTDFKQRFGEKLLWDKGVNVTALEEEDLRCGGLVLRHNMTISDDRLRELAEDCMVQKCKFISGGPEICPPDYKESDDNIFWIYFGLRFLATLMLSGGVLMVRLR
jgi:MFS_1 like family